MGVSIPVEAPRESQNVTAVKSEREPIRREGARYVCACTPETDAAFQRVTRANRRGNRRQLKKAIAGLESAIRTCVSREASRASGASAPDQTRRAAALRRLAGKGRKGGRR
jgi:hypothetical protein